MESLLIDGDVAIRILAAAALGMIVGIEREFRQKPAGVRTHMLVAAGAAGFMYLALWLVTDGPLDFEENVRADPTRIIEGIIGGIGFLGAGAIIQGRGDVSGLTTGASIWAAGAVGIACGLERYDFALFLTLIILLIVLILGWVERRIFDHAGDGEVRSDKGSKKRE